MSRNRITAGSEVVGDHDATLVVNTIGHGVCCLDAGRNLTFCNAAFLQMIGYQADDIIGRPLEEVLKRPPLSEQSRDSSAPPSDFSGHTSTHVEGAQFCRKNGSLFFADYWSYPFPQPERKTTHVLMFMETTDREKTVESDHVSGELLRQIGKNVDHMFYLLDSTATRFVYVSPACEIFTGKRCRDFYHQPSLWLDAVDPEQQKDLTCSRLRLRGGREAWCEYKVHHRDGRIRWIKDHANPIRDPNGTVRMFAGVAEDVTAVHEAQELLLEREKKFQRILASLPDVTWTADCHGRYSYISPRVEHILGYSHSEVYAGGAGFLQARIDPQDRARVHVAYEALFHGRRIFDEEYRIQAKNGDWVWIHDRAVRTHSESGSLYTDGVFSDISDRKNAEASLQSKTAFLEALVDSTMDGILVVDQEGQVLLANQRMFDLFKIPESLHDVHEDQAMLEHATQMVKDPDTFLAKVRYLYEHPDVCGRDAVELKDGTILDRYSSPVVGEKGRHYGRIWTFHDITQRKHNEDMLQQLSLAVEQSSVAIVITDPAGQITYVNRKFTECTGYSLDEVIGKNPSILNTGHGSPDFYKKLWSTISQGGEWRGEFRNRKKNGELFWETATITPVTDRQGHITHYLAIKEDITERRILEGQLRQAQKLEAIGQLAAGIAHEINTPTQFVMDNLTFLRDSWKSTWQLLQLYQEAMRELDLSLSPAARLTLSEAERNCDLAFLAAEVPHAIDEGLDGVRRVSKIVRAMKEFSHPDSAEKTPTDLNRAIESTITVARNEWKYVANVSTDFDPNLPLVMCFAGEMNQVILNLLVNAAHAIRDVIQEGEKGQISVTTRVRANFAEISVTDTGAGIPENIRGRIFDPFFTTKEVGKGTGQGLSLAHNVVVKKLRGRIWFETEVGRGTTFFVDLPIKSTETEPGISC